MRQTDRSLSPPPAPLSQWGKILTYHPFSVLCIGKGVRRCGLNSKQCEDCTRNGMAGCMY